jgi:uncharacterized protein with HEPN domain
VRDDRARLQDILEAVERIEKYAARGRPAFERDELVQTWIIHYLLVLGEAAGGLSVDFRKRHPEKVWAEAVGRRNILIHRYFGVEVDLVWPVVENDLPALKRMVRDILAGEYPPDSVGIV